MIAIIDYGMGNLRSVQKALESLGAKAMVTAKPDDIEKAEKVILPGVGAFPDAMNELKKRRLTAPIQDAIGSGKPYLGICLGLQLLFEKSEEGKGASGLGVFKGDVPRFRVKKLKVPHMGWNRVEIKKRGCPLFRKVPDKSFFYFVHSYYARPDDKGIIAAASDYGSEFAAMVWDDNVFAVQFHPEKSQAAGLRFLANFIKL